MATGREWWGWSDLSETPAERRASRSERSPWRDLTPPDPTGIDRVGRVRMSGDLSAYAYTYYIQLVDLHAVEGLR